MTSAPPKSAKAEKSARAHRVRETPLSLPEVNFSDYGDVRALHLGTPWIQGTMRLDRPYEIDLDYVQRMMAWLLFVQPEQLKRFHAMQLGLGAGSLTKFCRKKLRVTTTAIELNPQVVHACRGWFKLPADDSKLRVIVADAAEEIKAPQWAGVVDALQVDLYDDEAAAPVLDSADFYADCRALLSEDACMTVNLFGRASSFDKSVAKMAQAFGENALWSFKATREGNTVVLAQRTASRPKREVLEARADWIESTHALPARRWLKVFKPMSLGL